MILKEKKIISFIVLIIFLSLMLITRFDINDINSNIEMDSHMKVHFIDVGESDSTLIESNGYFMLIDAGDIDDVETISSYLDENNVKKLDYLILTHPHADHIGAASYIIKNYEIGKIIMPHKEHTTKTFENLLNTIEDRNLKITKPIVGDNYTIGNAKFILLAPNNYDYGDNINNYSISIKLINNNDSFIFIGDCELEAIKDIINNGIDLKSDVLMCGHHGSDTSTSQELLNKISPQNAIISVGKNTYGHPKKSVLKLLIDNNITTYRTDESGTIIADSTGSKITFEEGVKHGKISN